MHRPINGGIARGMRHGTGGGPSAVLLRWIVCLGEMKGHVRDEDGRCGLYLWDFS